VPKSKSLRTTDSAKAHITVFAYRAGAAIGRHVPAGVATQGARLLGRLLTHVMRSRRDLVISHQCRITPSLRGDTPSAIDARVRATFDSYAQYWVSMFRLQGKTQAEIDASIHIDGSEHIEAALAVGNGAIMAMPHIGAWDHGGAWLAGHWPLTVVAERLEPPELFTWFCDQRAKTGMKVVALGDETGGTALVSALRNNEVIGLLCDRDIVGGGIEVSFFGEPTTMPAGPAMLSLRTGAAILPNAVYQRPDGTAHGVIRAPIQFERTGKLRADVAALTQILADELADLIAAAPHQWHVLQPHWTADFDALMAGSGSGSGSGKSVAAGSVG
jgi:phosphatidylinositol dimannoside acyltransferase